MRRILLIWLTANFTLGFILIGFQGYLTHSNVVEPLSGLTSSFIKSTRAAVGHHDVLTTLSARATNGTTLPCAETYCPVPGSGPHVQSPHCQHYSCSQGK